MSLAHRYRSWSRALVLSTGLSATPWASHAQDVFVRVPVRLGGTAVANTLPYGEPFLLVGAATPEIKRIQTRFVSYATAVPDSFCTAAPLVPGTSVDPWVRKDRVKGDSFAVYVAELPANRRYAFCFETVSALDSTGLTDFQKQVYTTLDTTYAALDSAGAPPQGLSLARIREIRLQLARTLPKTPGQRIAVEKTVFDTLNADVPTSILVFNTEVLTARRSRFRAAQGWSAAATLTHQRLDSLRGDAVLLRIATQFSARDSVPGIDVARAAAVARMLAIPQPRMIDAIVDGQVVIDPSAVAPPARRIPEKMTDAAQVAVVRARVDSSYARLAELRELAAAIEASVPLQNRTGVGRAQAAALRAALDGILDGTGQIHKAIEAWLQADTALRQTYQRVARGLRVVVEDAVPVIGTSIATFENRARQTVSADVGLVYLPRLEEVSPYFGANFYLRALNKRVPLSFVRSELDRWSVTVGVTTTSLEKENKRDDLFSSFSILTGLGRRMTDAIRLSGGWVLYRDIDIIPDGTRSSFDASPYVSLSFDFDAKDALGGLGSKLFN